jgi:hypothetical protein
LTNLQLFHVQELDSFLVFCCTNVWISVDSDAHIQFFWKALESYTVEGRQKFLRFVWGRSRLPLNKDDFEEVSFLARNVKVFSLNVETCELNLKFGSHIKTVANSNFDQISVFRPQFGSNFVVTYSTFKSDHFQRFKIGSDSNFVTNSNFQSKYHFALVEGLTSSF